MAAMQQEPSHVNVHLQTLLAALIDNEEPAQPLAPRLDTVPAKASKWGTSDLNFSVSQWVIY